MFETVRAELVEALSAFDTLKTNVVNTLKGWINSASIVLRPFFAEKSKYVKQDNQH